ncbi:MAG TPA: metallophosphoesterase [Pedobacter sp.]|nr:metallophosphoesterase [Pedobacter sp.]
MISTKIIYNAVLKTEQVNDLDKFQVLPLPSGSFPYRLALDNESSGLDSKMIFHMVGDTGGTKTTDQQERIAAQMTHQHLCAGTKEDQPAFLYHLGDLAYHYGEEQDLNRQFLMPFEIYPSPVYAIAGNHDTDINPECSLNYESLDAFCTAFCNTSSKTIYFTKEGSRKSQVQPHVYWTMETPLAIIIGLHTNVPKYGHVGREQKNWFIKELKNAAENHAGKALIVCMHHAPYSADVNHGSSVPMIQLLESAFAASGVKPDVVFSGHVHNYQRFNKQYADGKTVPYIVAGAGGFDELHPLADPCDAAYDSKNGLFEDVQLENYCDNRYGFLKISIEKNTFSFAINGAYYAMPAEAGEALLFDEFRIDLTGR